MATNDFVPFCPTDTGTNLLSQVAYLADPQLAIGNQPGVARLQLVNKALRQATYIAASLAQFISNQTGNNVLDDATMSEVITTMLAAFTTPLNPYVAGYTVSGGGGSSTLLIPVNFNSNIVTDHYSLITTGSAWKFTAPFNCYVDFHGVLTNSAGTDILLYVNGVQQYIVGTGSSAGVLGFFNGMVKLNSTDYFDLRLDGGGSYTTGNFYCDILGRF